MPGGDQLADGTLQPDPGTGDWEVVPEAQLAELCGLDIAALRKAESELADKRSFAVVRHGRLCFRSKNDSMAEVFSTTKTLGAVMVGRAMYETRMIAKAGPKTGPLDEFQRVDSWLDSFTFHKDATIAHVLGMEAHNESLEYGSKKHSYDAGGNVQINRLIDVVRTAIGQDAPRLAGGDTTQFMQAFVFDKLGMKQSRWATPTIIAISWNTVLDDMARLGLLLLNGGVWNGERLLSTQYVYDMTHASFEDGSRDYGYLTWLLPPPCTPRAIHREYPHGPVSKAPDCGQPNCKQKYDVGVWYAGGLGGQFIMGHRALDMVVVGKLGEGKTDLLWNAVRPALVAMDPMYKGDDAAFCEAYSQGDYAPDLKLWEGGI